MGDAPEISNDRVVFIEAVDSPAAIPPSAVRIAVNVHANRHTQADNGGGGGRNHVREVLAPLALRLGVAARQSEYVAFVSVVVFDADFVAGF